MNKRIFYQLSRLITLPPGHNPFIPLIWPRLSCIIYYTRFLYPTYSTVIHSYFIPIQPSLSRIIFRHIFVFFIMNTVCISIISIIVAKYNNPRTSDQSFRSISTFLQQLSDHLVNIFIRKISFPRTSSISPRAKNARVTIPIAPYKTRVKKRVEWRQVENGRGKITGKGDNRHEQQWQRFEMSWRGVLAKLAPVDGKGSKRGEYRGMADANWIMGGVLASTWAAFEIFNHPRYPATLYSTGIRFTRKNFLLI